MYIGNTNYIKKAEMLKFVKVQFLRDLIDPFIKGIKYEGIAYLHPAGFDIA